MERQFISDITLDQETIRELNDHRVPAWRRWLTRLLAIALCLFVICGMAVFPEILKLYAGVFLIVYGLRRLSIRDGGPNYRKMLEENGGLPLRNMISISDGGIHYWNPETKNTIDVAFSEVRSIARTKRFLVLTTADGVTRFVNHSNVTGGTARELEEFLREKCGVEKIRVRRDDSIFRRMVVWAMVIGFCWSFFVGSNGSIRGQEYMDLHECAELLQELGVEGIDEELLNDLEQYGLEDWSVTDLLYFAGAGEYDFDTWEWIPSDSNVYSFDMEVFELSAMYTNFLRGVEAMSGGALEFSDITEDDSAVNWEAGTGTKTVTFTFEGQQYTLRPTMMSDWFDPDFAGDLADIVGMDENGRRLYFLYDGYQVVSIFYCNAAWAKHFTRVTGCALKTSL